jgi:hypothetical protein
VRKNRLTQKRKGATKKNHLFNGQAKKWATVVCARRKYEGSRIEGKSEGGFVVTGMSAQMNKG